MSEIKLGDRVRYKINGFEGIVTGACQYLYGCDQVLIAPETLDKDGNKRNGIWVDAPWVELVKAGVHKPTAAVEVRGKRVSGGPDREHPPEGRE